jgi:molybdenum cofactor cytidylyltransferase
MGSPKALLADREGMPFIVRVVATLEAAGLADITVVTGAAHQRIAAEIAQRRWTSAITVLQNPEPERGQLSSLHVAMDAAGALAAEALVMTLVDVPMTSVETVRALIAAWESSRAAIVRPAIDGEHGHPVIFDRRVFAELREAPLAEGAKHVVRRHSAEVEDVQVDDRSCLIDIDTPDEYQRWRSGRYEQG